MSERHVAIAGGGASGLLLAYDLVREGARVTVIEPRERLGAGVAYATTCPLHLLNAPANRMSAFDDEPDHFVDWLAAGGHTTDRNAFVPRALYGAYLQSIAEAARCAGGARFVHRRARAIDVTGDERGLRIACDDGSAVDAPACVVAVGNARPSPWPNVPDDVRASNCFFDSAWIDGATIAGAGDTVVLLGTGLTAVDAVLGLRHHGHRGPILMVSRRGLLPHEHRLFDSPPALSHNATTVAEVIAAAREARRDPDADWRLTIDALRGESNSRWEALSLNEQRRFVRHVLPYWNAHRHRMAPEAAKTIAQLSANGTLRMIAGRTGRLVRTADGIRVPVTLRGSTAVETIVAQRVINCSGPEHDVAKRSNPLLAGLLARDVMAAHPLRIGARVARDGALIDATGTASTRLYAIGPVRYGTLIETTAIPEIRRQVRELRDVLLGSSDPLRRQARREGAS